MSAQVGLEVRGLTVRYGGVVAVSDLWLSAPLGRCTGLIGPNGAGKTTVFDACFGLIPAATGEVRLLGSPISRLGPAARARRGLSRTFQRMELFDGLTVGENVEMGREAAWVGSNVFRSLYRSRAGRTAVQTARDEALELCGLNDLRHQPTGSLSTGQRRLVEFARALANPAPVLLLDEPSSGLDHAETEKFGTVLMTAVRTRGLAAILVEHDMELVSAVCEEVHVIDFGQKIFEGRMADAQQDPRVRSAYLGEPETSASEGSA
jgi:ABC-type branched-subunit amino acid transport system ATPase component